MRLTLILLCFILAAAAAGRYQAEAAVREQKAELKRLDREQERELTSIQLLRAEVAYLENPDRLAGIAENLTSLEPLSGAQLMTAEDFELAFGEAGTERRVEADGAAETRPVEVADIGAVKAR
ncbi:MAG TPA: hypothetical protein PKM48_05270 [Parvularculaceae bacterium]|nr:hypothetical protein [Parvularculaceae bacterium]HNS85701.1 hypothetical protein [Parvularculaceae bacterium]